MRLMAFFNLRRLQMKIKRWALRELPWAPLDVGVAPRVEMVQNSALARSCYGRMVPDAEAPADLDTARYPRCPRPPDRTDQSGRAHPHRREHPEWHDLPALWAHHHRAAWSG